MSESPSNMARLRELMSNLQARQEKAAPVDPVPAESESMQRASSGQASLPGRLSFKNYAAALSRLRRAGLTPTPAAVAAELAEIEEQEKRLGGVGESARQDTPPLRAPEPVDPTSEKLEAARAEVAEWKARHEEALGRVAELESQVEEMRVEAVLADSLEELIKEQKLSLEAAGSQIESLKLHLEEASAKASRVDGLESSLIGLRAEVEALQRELLQARRDLAASGSEEPALREQVAALEVKLESARAENLRAGEDFSRREKDFERRLAEAEAVAGALRAEIRELKDGAEAARQAAGEAIEARRSEAEAARAETRHTRYQFQGFRDKAAKTEEALRQRLAEAQSELATLRERNESLGRNLGELDLLRAKASDAGSEAAILRSQLAERDEVLARLREQEGILRHELDSARSESGASEALKKELDDYRESLTDARAQNRALVEKIEGMARALGEAPRTTAPRKIWVMPVAVAVVLGLAGVGLYFGLPRLLPGAAAIRENARALDQLKTQNSTLAAELNTTLASLKAAKQSELSIDRVRALQERLALAEADLAEFRREEPANLARLTKLQSDLDLATSRLERATAELTARDFRILELKRLLGDVSTSSQEIAIPSRLTLDTPELLATLPTIPEPDIAPASDISDFTADSLKALQAKAETAYRDKNFALAEVLYQRLANAAPENALALSNLAAVQLELGKLALAKTNILNALELKPDDAFSQTTLGMILIRTGEIDEAVAALLAAVEQDPQAADAFNYLGVAFNQQGQRSRAIQEIEKAVALSPGYSEAHFNLAVLHARGGPEERPVARRYYEKALALGAEPDSNLERLLR